jgi:DNA-binding beta-propeller fold protein YncE
MKIIIRMLPLVALLFISCERGNEPSLFPAGRGYFILNEGNYLAGNGSVSFYSSETGEIHNDLFTAQNGRALGDIPSFLAVDGDRGFIIVNNSGTIEVVDLLTMESITTVTGLNSPRQMVIRGRKGYVSSLSSNEVTVIDLDRIVISGAFNIGCTSEAMAISGGKLVSAFWAGGNRVVVTDLETEEVITSITVGLEPESMVLDRNNKLWVLCTGGWNGEEIPRLVRINTVTNLAEAEMFFRTVSDNPSSLTANAAGDTLYFIDEGVRRMPITASGLPSEAYITAGARLFYKLAAGPGGQVAVTDAIDYQQKGDFLVYNSRGELADTEQAGIIPGFMFFIHD